MKRKLRAWRWRRGAFTRLTLEGRAFLAMAGAAVAMATDVGRTEVHVLVLAILALLSASVLFTRAYRLTGVTVELIAPRRVTVGEEIVFRVGLQNRGTTAHRALRVEAPPRLREVHWTQQHVDLDALAPGDQRWALVHGRFLRRGRHRLLPFRAAALLPLGLAQGASLQTVRADLAVVPRVANVQSVSTPTGRKHQRGGVALASRTGDASELLGVRPYRAGDPLRDLHARSWARHGTPMVREYQETYFTRIGVVVDTDRNGASDAHFEASLSLAAGIIARLCASEALVDLLIVGATIDKISLGRSIGSLDLALDALAMVQPGPPFLPDLLQAELAPHLAQLSSVILVTPAEPTLRAEFASSLRARGVICSLVIVGDASRCTTSAMTVALQSIVSAEPIDV